MNEIAQAKAQVRLRNWRVMYQSYVESGQKVSQWCAENSVNPKTFYYRLKRLREDISPELLMVLLKGLSSC